MIEVPPRPGRIPAIDDARGSALLGMLVYHLTWDLANFGLLPPAVPFSPPMRIFSHLVASAFLGLVGVSLALAHRDGLRTGAFFRRIAVVAAAAAAVSLATLYLQPEEPIGFGILHCIAAASLLTAPLIWAPAWISFAAGLVALALPLLFVSPALDGTATIWLGLGARTPATLDWRPLLPWAGIVWLAYGAARIAPPGIWDALSARWRGLAPLGLAGRHSLAIYLLHQPLLFGMLWLATSATGFADRQERDRYLQGCAPACVATGGEEEPCRRACECVYSRAHNAGVAASLMRRPEDETVRKQVEAIVRSCGEGAD